jgi:hypothetical protein
LGTDTTAQEVSRLREELEMNFAPGIAHLVRQLLSLSRNLSGHRLSALCAGQKPATIKKATHQGKSSCTHCSLLLKVMVIH